MTTWKTAATACRELGFMLRRTGFGKECALYKVGVARPMDDAATYFTDDAQDAIETALAIHHREKEAMILEWAASHGVPERGSMKPISTRSRSVLRFWLRRAHKISTAKIEPLNMAELSAIWHDTTNAKLGELKQKGA